MERWLLALDFQRNTEIRCSTNGLGHGCLQTDGAGAESVDNFKAIFFDDRIGENFLGNAVELLLGFVAVPAVEIQDKEFSLTDVFDLGIAEPRECVLNGLSLGIENGALRHHPDVCFHGLSITLAAYRL